MRTASRLLAVPLVAVAALSFAVRGESTPEARAWIEKMASVYDRGPFRVDYAADLNVAQMGQTVDMNLTGGIIQDGRLRFRMNVQMQMTMSPPAEGASPTTLNMSMEGVSDGEVLWMEMDNPMLGGRQVVKMPLDKLEELGKANPMVRSMSNMDPVAQLQEMTRAFDFDVVDQSGGTVTLQAEMTEEALKEAGSTIPDGVDPARLREFVIVLDTETGFPREFRLGGDEPMITMRFMGFELLDSVDDTTFAYTPPEGANVTDLGAAPPPPAR